MCRLWLFFIFYSATWMGERMWICDKPFVKTNEKKCVKIHFKINFLLISHLSTLYTRLRSQWEREWEPEHTCEEQKKKQWLQLIGWISLYISRRVTEASETLLDQLTMEDDKHRFSGFWYMQNTAPGSNYCTRWQVCSITKIKAIKKIK